MSRQIIQLGVTSNDGEGDPVRLGGSKINQNFVETYSNLGDGATLPVASAFVQTTWSASTAAAFRTAIGAGTGSGSVVSVAMTVPSILNLAGSPITDSGTFVVTLAAQSANLVFAGPSSGASASPSFRAMASNDLPANLTGYTGSGGTFSGPTILNPTISGGTISGATISGATISGQTFINPTVSGGTFSGGTFSNVSIIASTFSGGTISGSTASAITIIASTFSGGTVSSATISGGTVSGASIFGGTHSGGTFSNVTVIASTFSGGTVSGATISGGTISGATISGQTIVNPTISGGAATGLTDLETDMIRLVDRYFVMFRIILINSAGTLQHKMTAPTVGSTDATNFVSRVTGASNTLTNTPTGADSSTAFAAGAKIGNPTSGFVLDTADQPTPGNDLIHSVLCYNDAGTAVLAFPCFASRNVNGTTRTRPEIRFFDATTGATFALNTTNIPSGKQIIIDVWGYWL